MTQQITAQLLKGGLTVDASGNITATKFIGDLQIGLFDQKTSIDISGTYTTRKLLMSDTYVLTGNVTINGSLILGKVSDDGNDIVLEGNYIFTTTGSGKIAAGYVIT